MLSKIEIPLNYAPSVCVFLRGKKWYWRYKLPNGEFFVCPVSEDEKLARRNGKLKEKELAKGLFSDAELTKIQTKKFILDKMDSESKKRTEIDLAIEMYFQSKKNEPGLTPRYAEDEKVLINGCMKYFKVHPEIEKTKSISRIKSKHIWEYRDSLLKLVKNKELRPVSASNRLSAVKRFFKFLKKRKLVYLNPCVDVDPIKFSVDEVTRNVALPVDAISKIEAADYRHLYHFPLKSFVKFLILTGARMGEALHAEEDDFDLESRMWRIQAKANCPTKFGLGWKPKNGTERLVPLCEEAVSLLRPLIEVCSDRTIVGYIKGDSSPLRGRFVFSMIDRKLSTRRIDVRNGAKDVQVWKRVDSIQKSWQNLFIKAGLCVPDVDRDGRLMVMYTRHDARRGWNEQAEKLGLTLKERSMILGHQPRVNMRNYNGETFLDMENVSEKLSHLSLVPGGSS